jgi:glycosyltransferase involved in cell wall biosynthesis
VRPTASVVVPTHDRNELLLRTLRSVLLQREVDIEVVVVDDGSTGDVGSAVGTMGDHRIRVVRNESSQGVARARNRGIEESRGKWVGFVDDDDLWAPDKLGSQLRAMQNTGRRWAYTGAVNIAGSGTVIGGVPPPPPEEVAAALPRRNAVPGGGSNVVAERSLLDEIEGFDPLLYNTEDWDMWIRMARVALPAWVPRPWLAYRVHRTNASLNVSEIIAGARTIERRYGGRVDRGMIDRYLAELCLRSGDRRRALRFFITAAVRGETRGVASDLASIARRKLRPSADDVFEPRDPGWIALGKAWIEELGEADP